VSTCGHRSPRVGTHRYMCVERPGHDGDHQQSGVVWRHTVQNGDVYACDIGTVVIRRMARDLSWADIKVVQPHGASWTKRQPLRAGQLPFPARSIVSSGVVPAGGAQ
jgi:hypothetical protein